MCIRDSPGDVIVRYLGGAPSGRHHELLHRIADGLDLAPRSFTLGGGFGGAREPWQVTWDSTARVDA
eukprot:12639084-Prorocentrum_lima.AAC.1